MTIQQLRTFCKVVEEKSFHRAAEQLYMAQASVSQQIAALEKYYSVLLFIRNGRSFSITPEGLALYKWASEILTLIDAIPESFAEMHRQSDGKLTLGASTLTGNYILPAILKSFKAAYPNVELSVHTGYGSAMVERIRSGTADLAIVGRNLTWTQEPALKFQPFAQDGLSLIVSPDHPWARRELIYPQELTVNDTFIHSRPGSAMRSMVEDYLRQENVQLKSALEMGNHETIKRAVEQGLGIALISSVCIARELKNGQLASPPLFNVEKISRQFILVSRRLHEPNYLEQAFISALHNMIPAEMKLDRPSAGGKAAGA